MIDRNSPIPIYYQLTTHFKQLIETGILQAGDRLPTEMELCEAHGISRAPVRRALTDLAREGYIYRRPGQGSFVQLSTPQPKVQQVNIQILIHYDIRWMDTMERAIYHWNQQHPEQEAKLEIAMCDRAEFHETLQRRVAQGRAPDIVPMDCVWIADYATAGYITPLDKLDAQWVKELQESLEPTVVQANTVEGHLYGLPVQTDITGLWYRRDWFDEAEIAVPQTWAEWIDVIDYFSTPESKAKFGHRYAIALPVGTNAGEATFNTLMPFLWATGKVSLDEKHTLSILRSDSIHQALTFLQKITVDRREFLPPKMSTYSWWDITSLLATEVIPMSLGGTYEWPRLQEDSKWDSEIETAEHLGFVPIPRPSQKDPCVCSLGGTSWAILEQSRVSELILDILKVAASAKLSASFCEENLQISPHRMVNQQMSTAEHPWLTAIIPQLETARLRPSVKNYIQTSHVLQEMIEQILWEGASVQETTQRTIDLLALLNGS